MRFFGLVRVPRPPSYCLEPNALAVCLLRRSEMRPPFRCRPSGSPSEAMGNTGSGNPHRPPDGGQSFPNCSPFGLGRVRPADAILLWLRSRTPFPSAEGLAPRKSGGCNPRLVCAASYKAVWRPHLRFASRRKNRFFGRLPRAGKMLQDFYPPFYVGRQGGRAAMQSRGGSGVSAAACSMRRMEAGGFILRAAASDAFVVPPHFQSCIMNGRACPALGFAVRRPMLRSKAAVHRVSSMRIRKPANALAGKRPKHRRAKPRQRGPRPARDGRRGWMGKGRSGVAVRRRLSTPRKPGLSAAKRRRRTAGLSSNRMLTKIILTNFAIFVMMNVRFLRPAYF